MILVLICFFFIDWGLEPITPRLSVVYLVKLQMHHKVISLNHFYFSREENVTDCIWRLAGNNRLSLSKMLILENHFNDPFEASKVYIVIVLLTGRVTIYGYG